MPRFETLAFYFCAFWVCFFGGCAGQRSVLVDPDPILSVQRLNNDRINDHSIELISVRNDLKFADLRGDALHKHHLDGQCRMIDRFVSLDARIKRIEERMVIVTPEQMPPPPRLMDPRELDPNPNIPPQKLPVTPSGE